MVQTEGTPDHDGAAAKGHRLLDCRVNKTFLMMPSDMQLTVVVVECKAPFITAEDLNSLLTIPPHMMPAECAASCSVCGCQAWSYCWATGTEVDSMYAFPDGLPANVHLSRSLQLPVDGTGRRQFWSGVSSSWASRQSAFVVAV